MGTPENFNDDYRFNDEIRFDFEIDGKLYSDSQDIAKKDLPKTEKEMIQTLKLMGKNPLAQDIKIFELTCHLEEDYDFDGFETYKTTIFVVDDLLIMTDKQKQWLINQYYNK